MTGKTEFEEQEAWWEREKTSLQAAIREAEVQNNELQGKMKYQEILMEEYK